MSGSFFSVFGLPFLFCSLQFSFNFLCSWCSFCFSFVFYVCFLHFCPSTSRPSAGRPKLSRLFPSPWGVVSWNCGRGSRPWPLVFLSAANVGQILVATVDRGQSWSRPAMECQMRVVFERHDAVCRLCATRKNSLGDLLDADAEKFSAARTTLVARIVANTWDLKNMQMWCMVFAVYGSVMCGDVQCGKTCRLVINLTVGCIVHQ